MAIGTPDIKWPERTLIESLHHIGSATASGELKRLGSAAHSFRDTRPGERQGSATHHMCDAGQGNRAAQERPAPAARCRSEHAWRAVVYLSGVVLDPT